MNLRGIAKPGSLLKRTVPEKKKRQTARHHDDGHLEYLRKLPCVVTGRRPVEAAHIRYGSLIWGKPLTGKGIKPDDRFALPLHPDVHRAQHEANEFEWWGRVGLDPLVLAMRLWEVSGDIAEGEKVCAQALKLVRPSWRKEA